jgi:hypothetical protein
MKLKNILCTISVALACSSGFAQTNATSTPPPSGGFDKLAQEIKNPVPWLNWGGDLRLRNEYLNNAITLGSNLPLSAQDYFRFRGRVWATVTPLTNVAFFGRIAAEPRLWEDPSYARAFYGKEGIEWRYGIVDGLNLKLTNLFGIPMNLTIGRQDVQFGDPLNWWLVGDGTPGDGSWTFFLDSVRLSYEAKPIKTKFDVVYINQHSDPGKEIPTISDSSAYYLTEQNEQGVIFYASNTSLQNTTLDGYFIWKNDNQVLANGDTGNIYTVGGRIANRPTEHWYLTAEGAYQFGQKQDPNVVYPVNVGTQMRDINAFGANAKATYLFKDKLNNQLSFVAEFLSGDNPNTPGKDEMFDVLWGRWPRWSELYIYSYLPETGNRIAQMNNLERIGANWTFNPFIKGMTLGVGYNALFAFEAVPTRRTNSSASQFSYDGNFRGHFVQAVLKHQFNKHISGHLWGEWVWQGNFYTQGEIMTFLRAELMFTF